MIAYHNDQTIKDAILAQLAAHRKDDEIIKGMYWEDVDEQLANEAQNKMELAYRTSERFNAATGQATTWRDTMPFIQSLSANPPNPAQAEEVPPEQS